MVALSEDEGSKRPDESHLPRRLRRGLSVTEHDHTECEPGRQGVGLSTRRGVLDARHLDGAELSHHRVRERPPRRPEVEDPDPNETSGLRDARNVEGGRPRRMKGGEMDGEEAVDLGISRTDVRHGKSEQETY